MLFMNCTPTPTGPEVELKRLVRGPYIVEAAFISEVEVLDWALRH